MRVNAEQSDHFIDECGVFGVHGIPEASHRVYLGLHALQHRGQEAAGIVSAGGDELHVHRGLGLVPDVFDETTLARLPGSSAIGHVRYATAGESNLRNAQPLAVRVGQGCMAIAHNGNLTNAVALRAALESEGSIFQTSSDTEVVLHLIARSRAPSAVDRVIAALKQVEGAYSMLLLTANEMIAVRDPFGFRPLCMGKLGDAVLFASEPPAFELIGGHYERDVEPGEMLIVGASGVRGERPFAAQATRMCVFEYVYFARPDAHFRGTTVYDARRRLGAALAREAPVDADIVIPVPDSGVAAALGFAAASKLPFELGLIRSHYVGRTFIEPQHSIRDFGVRLKLHPVRSVLAGHRVAVVDDSIVRGTTSRKIVRLIRGAGALEVHMRISSPPTKWPCFYGIDTPEKSELIANQKSLAEIRDHLECDSVGYLSVGGLREAVGGGAHCDACFTGDYPVPVGDEQLAKIHRKGSSRLVGA